MKQILALLICFELLIAPIAPSLRLLSTQSGFSQSESCPEGQTFSNERGRCILTQANAQALNNANTCDDPSKTAEQKAACYREFAEGKRDEGLRDADGNLIEKPSTQDGMQFGNEFAKGAAIAVPMVLAIEMIKNQGLKSTCAAASFIALVAGAVALFGVEIGANYAHGVRLNKIQDSWNEIVSKEDNAETNLDKRRENSADAQKQAFYKLAEMERSLATALKWKAIGNGVASVAFFTAMGIAIAEQVAIATGDASSICATDGQKESLANDQQEAAEAQGKADDAKAAADKADADKAAADKALEDAQANKDTADQALKDAQARQTKAKAAWEANKNPATEAAAKAAGEQTQAAQTAADAAQTAADAADKAAKAADEAAKAAGKAAEEAGKAATNAAGKAAGPHHGSPQRFEETPKKGSLKEAIEFSFHDWDEDIIKMKNIENIKSAKDFRSYYTLINGVHKKYSSPSLDEYEEMKEKIEDEANIDESEEFLQTIKKVTISILKGIDPLPEVLASEGQDQIDYTHFTWITLGAGALAGGLLYMIEPVKEFLVSPPGRITVGALLGGWALTMTIYNIVKMNDANKRADILEQLGDDVPVASDGLFGCEENDRNNPGKPECYCFTAEGPRNTNRINSQVCQAYFGIPNDLIASSYQSSSSSVGCIDANRQPDPKCSCKKSSKKCMSVSPKNVGNLDLGSFKMLGNAMKPINQLANGSLDSAKVSASSLANQAARIRKRNEKILKSPKFKNLAKKVSLGEKKLEKLLTNAASKLPPPRNEARSIPNNPKAAVAALEKDLKEAKEQFKEIQAAPGVNPGGGGGGEKEPGLDFGMTMDDLEAQKGDLAKAMNQKLDYGQNDISASDGNIFQVLSNRYMRSGMRRLFDEEGKLEAEKPAESDINK